MAVGYAGAVAEITLVIGGTARWDSNGSSGKVQSLVVDPGTRVVTYLVVEPSHRRGLGRLVPIALVTETASGELTLACTEAEFEDLKPAEQTIVELSPGFQGPLVLLPGTESWRGSDDFPAADGQTLPPDQPALTVDIVNEELPGAEEENRGDRVHATDGDIGRLHALSVVAGTGGVTNVILGRHPWGSREIFVPIGDVTSFKDGIHLGLSKGDVEDLTR
jgi:hypothetical protein